MGYLGSGVCVSGDPSSIDPLVSDCREMQAVRNSSRSLSKTFPFPANDRNEVFWLSSSQVQVLITKCDAISHGTSKQG